MTTCTPVYGLEYQTGTDRPCDAPAVWCDFAATVESNLDRLDAVVNRTIDTIPIAQVRLTVPFAYDNGIGSNVNLAIPFDTVDVDTDNMVDLAANPYVITLPSFGRYAVDFQVLISTIPNTDTHTVAAVGDTGSSTGAFDVYISDVSTPIPLNGSTAFRYNNIAPAELSTPNVILQWSFFSAGVLTMTAARMSIYWIGDLP